MPYFYHFVDKVLYVKVFSKTNERFPLRLTSQLSKSVHWLFSELKSFLIQISRVKLRKFFFALNLIFYLTIGKNTPKKFSPKLPNLSGPVLWLKLWSNIQFLKLVWKYGIFLYPIRPSWTRIIFFFLSGSIAPFPAPVLYVSVEWM
jgi:hypothetical protein